MAHVKTAYVLGYKQASMDFGAWLGQGLDNPTAPPKKTAALVKEVVEKLGAGPVPAWQRINEQRLGRGRGITSRTQPLRQQSPSRGLLNRPATQRAQGSTQGGATVGTNRTPVGSVGARSANQQLFNPSGGLRRPVR